MSSFREQLRSLPSVAGIVHTAMVLRDELIKDLEFSNFIEVMSPKIKGKLKDIIEALEYTLDLILQHAFNINFIYFFYLTCCCQEKKGLNS